ncbi:NAD(P)/FAD-dependent oxidoreductase [Photobacterium damselae]
MKIAIIGSGISGLTCAWYLQKQHQVSLYEANDYLGGHTATVDVEVESGHYAIDTGFIVFNDRTYPNFERLLKELNIKGQDTQMSFSVHNQQSGLEYNGHTLATLFAQKANLVNPRFYRFLYEIVKFNREAKKAIERQDFDSSQTLGDFLNQYGFSDYFCTNYILPMGAAIWSSTLSDMRKFPLPFFLKFFLNHGLLDITHRPQWKVIPGGSRQYINKMLLDLKADIRLNTPVLTVHRFHDRADVVIKNREQPELHQIESFDQVIFACHSDQALAMLAKPSINEKEVLGNIHYQDNEVVLHTDTNLLPIEPKAWAAWNYHLFPASEHGSERLAALTYNMNILQGLQSTETFCVSLNQTERIDPTKILRTFTYSHPVFSTQSIAAQQKRHDINGFQRSWFCGAYWYNGFHEDGVRSALDVIEAINELPSQSNYQRSA